MEPDVVTAEVHDSDYPVTKRAKTDHSVTPLSNIVSPNLKQYSPANLRAFTDDFSTNNLIGKTQFGQVYRGKIEETGKDPLFVTIKTWNDRREDCLHNDDRKVLLGEEARFLTLEDMAAHPNLVKLIGYCCEDELKGVVYDLNSLDTLNNLMLKDDFGWKQRIHIAIALARVLAFLHGQEYTVFNVDTAHIMLDQDFSPLIFDFGLMGGGIIGERSLAKQTTPMTPGYGDLYGASVGIWSEILSDVYSYGGILIELIAKRITDMEDYCRFEDIMNSIDWVLEKRESRQLKSPLQLVHQSLKADRDYDNEDALLVAKLAMSCIKFYPEKRPKMEDIVKRLEDLSIMKEHGSQD